MHVISPWTRAWYAFCFNFNVSNDNWCSLSRSISNCLVQGHFLVIRLDWSHVIHVGFLVLLRLLRIANRFGTHRNAYAKLGKLDFTILEPIRRTWKLSGEWRSFDIIEKGILKYRPCPLFFKSRLANFLQSIFFIVIRLVHALLIFYFEFTHHYPWKKTPRIEFLGGQQGFHT